MQRPSFLLMAVLGLYSLCSAGWCQEKNSGKQTCRQRMEESDRQVGQTPFAYC